MLAEFGLLAFVEKVELGVAARVLDVGLEILLEMGRLGNVCDIRNGSDLGPRRGKSIVDYVTSCIWRWNPGTDYISSNVIRNQAIRMANTAQVIEVTALAKGYFLVRVLVRL